MVKCEVIGMLDIAKINPVLTSDSDVANYSFIEDDGVTYLVCNTIVGDDAYKDNVVIPAGEYLNGYDLSAWVNKKLVIDGKHITGGVSGLTAGTSTLVVGDDGKLATGTPDEGEIGFKVTDKVTLTEAAVKAMIIVGTGA